MLWLDWMGPGGVLAIQEQGAYIGIQVLPWPLVEKGDATQGVGGPFFLFEKVLVATNKIKRGNIKAFM